MRTSFRPVRWCIAVVAGAAFAVLPVAAPASAGGVIAKKDGASQVTLNVKNNGGAFVVRFCLKTTTTMKRPAGSDRSCSGWLSVNNSWTLTADVTDSLDEVFLDTEVDKFFGTETQDNKLITGATDCEVSGTTENWPIRCNTPKAPAVPVSPPSVAPFAINAADPNDPAMSLLNLLAWCVTAAAVAGLIVTGMNMALQMRRGEPGEFSEHWRGFLYVGAACLVGATAGPVVSFLGLPY
ncbi:hypothetical protein [Krasilnikovia sp. MM14-A1004]|uniref:hypothetical protein n=1 Tax=Krasilnikovia sp. MM14-A1004 TaxID=3373541 RepID=UPI00399C7D1C